MKVPSRVRASRARSSLSPVIVVAWVWAGILSLLLLYLRSLLSGPGGEAWANELGELWWGPSAMGLSLRYLLKIVNLLLVVLVWLKWRSLRREREVDATTVRILYLGTAALLLALEWACHVFGKSLPPWPA